MKTIQYYIFLIAETCFAQAFTVDGVNDTVIATVPNEVAITDITLSMLACFQEISMTILITL